MIGASRSWCPTPAPAILAGDVGSLADIAALSDAGLARIVADAEPWRARAAEGELYARFARRVRLYGRRHLGSDDAAAELVQRVLVLTIEKLRAGAVRDPDRIASFVLGTARMVAHELRRGDRRAVSDDDLPEQEDLTHRLPEPIARGHLARCLESLSERERAVVVLSYFGDHSTAEIATTLALAEPNVRVVRHRSIARLRACMGLAGAGEDGAS